ncbi:hypothetical protein MN116_000257 [Schistosoma mekongi]|uniref:Tetraspanin n=1 Tax=Schistosoma mekongi TaxID=38744 RepID=A0AAE2D1D6_SCHME|nr:hypothetical protein MN116_000257 [Schistosoma mekongi]
MPACGCILTIINSIFLAISIAIAIAGGIFAWSSDTIKTILNSTLVSYITTTFSSKMTVNTTTLVNNIISIVQPIGVVIFIIGMVIMAICLLGIIGVCCRSKVCLGVYLAVVIAITVCVVALIIVYKTTPTLVTSVLDSAISSWATSYVSIVSGDTDSVLFAALMMLLNCCGSTSVTDITTSSKFSTTDTYSSTSYTPLVRPIPCCKFDSSLALKDSTCPTTSSSTEQNDSVGCKTVIQSYITSSADVIMYVSFGVLAFFVLLIVLASCAMANH